MLNTYNGGSFGGQRKMNYDESSDSSLSRGVGGGNEDQYARKISTYNEIPMKSYSKDMLPSSSYNVGMTKF